MSWVEDVLLRESEPAEIPDDLTSRRVMVTGSSGSIGTAVVQLLRDRGATVIEADLPTADVTLPTVRDIVYRARPAWILHLAGAKHAPAGEEDPDEVVQVNTIGTRNVLIGAALNGAHVVTASTCKACNPETAYGASKLIAERMTLNAGGVVARFHNVVNTQGNVFEHWQSCSEDEAIPVAADCSRYFISLEEAAHLMIFAAGQPSGRYIVIPTRMQKMGEIAKRLYPRRAQLLIPPRRGDRVAEPLIADQEKLQWIGGRIARITSQHDAAADR